MEVEEILPVARATRQDDIAGLGVAADEDLFGVEAELGWQPHRLAAAGHEDFGDVAHGGTS
jgi:hypothetical protein